jgi:hypothetical protein
MAPPCRSHFWVDRHSGTRGHALSTNCTGLKNPYVFFT